MVYQPFVAADSTMQPVLWLAELWEVDSSAKEWTFKVRQGVKFHDGSQLSADDVVSSFQRLLDPALASPVCIGMGA